MDEIGLLRERTIRRLLATWPDGPDREGIYGGGVCQVCGRFTHFFGLAAAMGSHRSGELVGGVGHHHSDAELVRFDEQPQRFCELCRGRTDRSAATSGRRAHLCGECFACIEQLAPGRSIDDVLHRLRRWRYWRIGRRRKWPEWAEQAPPSANA